VRRRRVGGASELDAMAVVCLLPSLLYVVIMFVYPFLNGIYLSLRPAKQIGLSLANYVAFFSDEWQYRTVWITFGIAVPNTVVVVAVATTRRATSSPTALRTIPAMSLRVMREG